MSRRSWLEADLLAAIVADMPDATVAELAAVS